MKNIFKRKQKESGEVLWLLVDYIKNAKIVGYSDKKIMRQFIQKGYPNELILNAFELNIKQEEKMKKKEEYEEEEDEDEEDEEETPVVKKKVEEKLTINDVLTNHEQRIASLEAKLFRMLTA